MPRWRLSRRAEEDIRLIYRTIASDNPAAADRVFTRIIDKIEMAAEYPQSGSVRSDLGSNTRILDESPYIVIYQPTASGIFVTAVVHGAREPGSWV